MDTNSLRNVYVELLRENYGMIQEYRSMMQNYLHMCNNYWRYIERQESLLSRFAEQLDTNSREEPDSFSVNSRERGFLSTTPTIHRLTPVFSRRRGVTRPLVGRRTAANVDTPRNTSYTDMVRQFSTIFDVLREESDVPARQYSATDISNSTYDAAVVRETACPIGLEDFVEGEEISTIVGCGHIFKKENLDRWLRRNHCCPICRYDIDRGQPASTNNTLDETRGIMEFILNIDLSGNVLSREPSDTPDFDLDAAFSDPAIQRALSGIVLSDLFSFGRSENNTSRERGNRHNDL